jgi:hypothetical protein
MKKVSQVAAREEAAEVAAAGMDLGDRWSHWCELSRGGEAGCGPARKRWRSQRRSGAGCG